VIWALEESDTLPDTPFESFRLVMMATLTPPMTSGRMTSTIISSIRVNPSSP
jgi:hypothetical protein